MGLEKEITVLGVKRLDFENNGDKVQGVSVHFYSDSQDEENVKGCIPNKAWLSLSSFPNFEKREYPALAICEMDIDMAKGKLVPKNFTFLD